MNEQVEEEKDDNKLKTCEITMYRKGTVNIENVGCSL